MVNAPQPPARSPTPPTPPTPIPEAFLVAPTPAPARRYPGVVDDDDEDDIACTLSGQDLLEFWDVAAAALEVRRRVHYNADTLSNTSTRRLSMP